jgi:hypothetical protein
LQNLVHVPPSEPEYEISKSLPLLTGISLTIYDTVAQKFYEGWKHPKAKPTINNIFYVAYSGLGLTHLGKFSDYRYINLLESLD